MTFVHCDLRLENCTVEAYVNRIPVLRLTALDHVRVRTRPMTQFIVDGSNHLEVIINPGPTPSRARQAAEGPLREGAKALVQLVEYEEGQLPGRGRGRELARIAFEAESGQPPAALILRAEPVQIATRRTWEWQRASTVSLDRGAIEGLTEMLRTMHDAFAAHDPVPILDRMRLYHQDYAIAYPGQTYQKLIDDAIHDISEPRAVFNVAPFDPEKFDFRLCAGGRLIDCVDRDWNAILRADIGYSMPWSLQFFAGFTERRWQALA